MTEATQPAPAGARTRALAATLGVLQVVGAVVARRHAVPARPFGIRIELGPRLTPLVWGTAISAPLVMAAALGAGAARPERTAPLLFALGAAVTVGQLGEPVAWRRHRPAPVAAIATANLVVAPALAGSARQLLTTGS